MCLHLTLPAMCEGGKVGEEREEGRWEERGRRINKSIHIAMHRRTMLG